MRRRVVITGMGLVTSLGCSPDAMWSRILRGESGIGLTTLFDTSNFPTRISAEVRNWSIADVGEDPQQLAALGATYTFCGGRAKMAVQHSGLDVGALDPTRLGVYLGCGDAYPNFNQFVEMITASLVGDKIDMEIFARASRQLLNSANELEMEPHMPAAHVAALFNAQGPHVGCFTACAASSQAIGEAADMVRRGQADVMLAGGAHSLIHPFGVTGLNLLTALSTHNDEPTKASRPFDRDRDGFVLGEGGGVVVVEELDHAVARGAQIYGEVSGYGASADAYRITDSHPEGRGAASCMRLALEDAQLNPEDIGYINAHGTSTAVNDRVETMAIKRVFGASAYGTPISSTKSMTGHLLAAAGVVETIISLQVLRQQALPPTINYDTPDADCDLDYVPNHARDAKCKHVLTNSFGFGGQNVALVLSRVA